MQYHAIPCNTTQNHAIPCKTMSYHAIPCNIMQYHAIPCITMQYQVIPCNTMQYHAIPCNTMQYHASLINADGAYHCPVGSIMAIFTYVNPISLANKLSPNCLFKFSCNAFAVPNCHIAENLASIILIRGIFGFAFEKF